MSGPGVPERHRKGEGVPVSHPQLVVQTDRLEIHSPMRIGMRVLLAALALFPLIAPYEVSTPGGVVHA